MKAIQPVVLSVSILALASAAAYAGGDAKNKTTSSGASTSARYDFDKADTNKDGRVSRAEFDAMMKGSASAGGSATKAGSQANGKTSNKPSTSSK
jgi:hypothetical protein